MLHEASTSQIIATIIGLYFVIIGIGVLFERQVYGRLLTEFSNNLALTFLTGIMAYIVGAVILVVMHGDWSTPAAMIVSAFGWIVLIKGALVLAFRQPLLAFVGWLRPGPRFAVGAGLASILLGGVLLYLAFKG